MDRKIVNGKLYCLSGDGEVTFQEFCQVSKEMLVENEEDLRAAFTVRKNRHE